MVDRYSSTARTSSELRILNSFPSSLISVPPYLATSTRSPFFISKGTFLPLSSVLPVPRATIRLSMGFSLAVSGIIIPPFWSSFSSTASTRIRSPMGLTFSFIICYFFFLIGHCSRSVLHAPAGLEPTLKSPLDKDLVRFFRRDLDALSRLGHVSRNEV